MNFKKAVTLLELMIVLAILTVLIALVIFAIRPDEILSDTRQVERNADADEIEKALQAYKIDNKGRLPEEILTLADGVYSICKYADPACPGGSVNFDFLVDSGYLPSLPEENNCSITGTTCFNMVLEGSKAINILADSDMLRCPTGYIRVPGNPLYSITDFCVMKYEAKNVSSIATSQAAGLPWVNITQLAAITACSNLGSGYHLITNEEWMTTARNIEQVSSNWTSGIVGTGALYSGHTDSIPANFLAANADDNQGYEGTEDVAPSQQRRTLTLSNGQVIWDLSGNAGDWNSNVISCAATNCTSLEMPYSAVPAETWVEFPNLATYGQLSYDLIRPSNPTWNSTNRVGLIYTDTNAADPSGNIHAFLRGGFWHPASGFGLYSLSLNNAPTYSSVVIGFRCVYTPNS